MRTISRSPRNLAVQQARKRRDNEPVCFGVGSLETDLTAAQIALNPMITPSERSQPSFETSNQIMMGRALVEKAVLNVVDRAMDIAGGRAFRRPFGLEKLFRDAQGVRYHPIREEEQRKLAGRFALCYPAVNL
ncbi:MAG: acyl-CoA dehydrogenase family protein [Synechococcus sp.]